MHSVKISRFSASELQQIQGQKSQFWDAMELIYEVFFGSSKLLARPFVIEKQHIIEHYQSSSMKRPEFYNTKHLQLFFV
jgi:hypothetical protein